MERILLLFVLAISCSQSNAQTFGEMINQARTMNSEPEDYIALGKQLNDLFYSSHVKHLLSDPQEMRRLLAQGNVSQECQKTVNYARTHLNSWSIGMLDATAKPPASFFYGAVHWIGGFEQCMQNVGPQGLNGSGPLRSHYCRGYFKVRVQRKVNIDVGFCIPEACSANDLQALLNQLIDEASTKYPIVKIFRVHVMTTNCLLRQEEMKWSTDAIAMLAVCGVFALVMLIGTLYDLLRVQKVLVPVMDSVQTPVRIHESHTGDDGPYHVDGEDTVADTNELIADDESEVESTPTSKWWQKFLISFSVYTNAMKIIDTSQQPGRLNCLDGIRFLSMSWVILGHTYVFAVYFINNILYLYPIVIKRWTYAPILNGTFSVDSFFVLSGLLTAFMFLKEAHRRGSLGIKFWLLFYFHRYWRLTPAFILFLKFYSTLTVYMSNGPFWSQENGLDMSNCQKNWWQNILYINNLFKEKDTCMAWTWYLANDMQFHFIVAPIVLTIMFYFGMWGVGVAMPVILGSMIATGIIARGNGNALPDMQENVYFKPWCRVSTYVVGLIVGYLIFEYKRRNWRLHWSIVVTGWIVAAGFCLSVIYGLNGITSGSYTVSTDVAAFYTSTSRFVWSVGLSWVIFACLTGYGGWINSFLSWKFFIPLSRLTYCAYLVHPVVIFVFYLSLQYSPSVTSMTTVYWFLGHLTISYMIAFVLSVSCESPFIGLEKIILRK